MSKNKKLLNVLKNEKKFEAFVHWMYREFSSETILCFIELLQFKQLLKEKIIVSNDVISEQQNVRKMKGKREYILYENIPKSSIVYGNDSKSMDDISCFRNIAHLLYEKYVKINGELEVNIGFGLRDTYFNLDKNNYQDIEASKFIGLFDEVMEEMFKFMVQSFRRFDHQESTEYSAATPATP
eukprot:85668_1